jgi:hypothetical protein
MEWQEYSGGNIQIGVTGDLPDQIQYVAGFDYGVTKKFTLAMDYLGQRQLNARRVNQTTFRAANDAVFPPGRHHGRFVPTKQPGDGIQPAFCARSSWLAQSDHSSDRPVLHLLIAGRGT